MKVICKENKNDFYFLTIGREYDVRAETIVCYCMINDRGFVQHYPKDIFDVVRPQNEEVVASNTLDKHYNFSYTLTEEDVKNGFVKIDPYFVSKQWKLGEKDNSGALWHCFKTIARFGEKNTKEREIKAIYLQIKRLAELENVALD